VAAASLQRDQSLHDREPEAGGLPTVKLVETGEQRRPSGRWYTRSLVGDRELVFIVQQLPCDLDLRRRSAMEEHVVDEVNPDDLEPRRDRDDLRP
jgi:hypothetical protein